MIVGSLPCPSPELLARLGSDSLPAADFEAIESHVQDCASCQEMLERLSADEDEDGDIPPVIPGFVIERELGRGGMGVVYQAWQPELARRVALKVLTRGPLSDPAGRRRWLREARAMGRVRHRNVVRLHDAGEASGRLFLVLDLIAGGSLKDRAVGPIAPRVAATILEAVARAVGTLHASGMLHLDIKPSNILLDGPVGGPLKDAVPLLADFGLARGGDDPNAGISVKTGDPLVARGTPAFMAPEQIEGGGDKIGPYTDVFALGCTLYALVTGRSPFQGASVVETLDLVRTRDPVPPRSLVSGVSRDLETILLKCLRRDVRARYPTADALADDLRRMLDGRAIHARSPRFPEQSIKWCRRRPAVAGLLGLLAATFAASFIALAMLWRHSDAQRRRAEAALSRAVENEAMVSRVRSEMINLLMRTLPSTDTFLADRSAEVMKLVGDQTKRLCDVQGLAAADVAAIAEIECRMAWLFHGRGKADEARSILEDALRLVEHYRRTGMSDRKLEAMYQRILLVLGWLLGTLGRVDDALAHYDRAVAASRAAGDFQTLLLVCTDAYGARHHIADSAVERGNRDVRRRVLASNLAMAEGVDADFHHAPLSRLLLAVTRSDFEGNRKPRDELKHAFLAIDPEDKRQKPYRYIVKDWMSLDVLHDLRIGKSVDGTTPDERASRVLAAIQLRRDLYAIPRDLMPQIALRLTNQLERISTENRHAGRPEDAERAALCLEAIGRKLCLADASQADYHLIISRAYAQHAKNAWRHPDLALVMASLRRAIAEAERALELRPDDEAIRGAISGLRNKLMDLVLGLPASSR
jgi:serine/threonine protein kinase/tetratricopeptide (TPR) repeat protein